MGIAQGFSGRGFDSISFDSTHEPSSAHHTCPAAGSALALVTVSRLAPDSVFYSLPAELYGAHPTQDSVAVATQRTPRIYTGGSFCATDSFGSYQPAILAELP